MNIITPVDNTQSIRYADFVRITTRVNLNASDYAAVTAGVTYTILKVGTSSFTSIGAPTNTVGTVFVCTTTTTLDGGTGILGTDAVYRFSSAPYPIKIFNNDNPVIFTASCNYDYPEDYYIYTDFDASAAGLAIGQYVSGGYIQDDTIIDFITDLSTPGNVRWEITLSKPVTNTVVDTSVTTFSEFAPEEFAGLGELVQTGSATRDIKSTANETTFTLVGIDTAMLGFVLGQNIKGSKIEAWHGFFNTNNQLITTGGDGGLYRFFTGTINSFAIQEEWMEEIRSYVGIITVSASAIQMILKNRIAGRYTNANSWAYFSPGDASMDRVAFVSTINYQFGKQQ